VTFLGTVGEIVGEGERMRHCIATRAQDAVHGRCHLFHVEHEGQHASVEVSPEGKITEAQGPHNTDNVAVPVGRDATAQLGRRAGRTGRAGYTRSSSKTAPCGGRSEPAQASVLALLHSVRSSSPFKVIAWSRRNRARALPMLCLYDSSCTTFRCVITTAGTRRSQMAYVRRRGNQLAIVRGEREPGTGKVQQQILFTFYSKAEVHEALGRGSKAGADRFQHLLQREHPDVKFNWKTIRRSLDKDIDLLPERYEYKGERLRRRFRADLCAFARQLMLADPQDLMSAAQLIQEHHHELEYVADLIQWRLKLRDQKESEWNVDNPFYWRFTLQGRDVPPDTEEHAAGFYERGEHERAEAVFRLLVECFDGYAEGYNYLGLIALDRRQLDDALAHFQKTIELGRKLFPARISKKRYWNDHATRPYMRGLRNSVITLTQAGRFDEAMAFCDRLDDECGDNITTTWHRAVIYLNTGKWQPAAEAAQRLTGLYPDANLIAAFALYELGRIDQVLSAFLHGALNHPRAARMLLGERTTTPKSSEEIRDHNAGVSLRRELHAFLKNQSRASKRFFRTLVRDPRVVRLLDEIVAVVERRMAQHPTGEREAFERMTLMHSREFAQTEAHRLRDYIAGPGATGFTIH
jgi:tetratricopeptide (TPR) repeat protein